MNSSEVNVENKPAGKCLLDNWVEEGATALLDNTERRLHIHKNGHRVFLTVDTTSKVHGGSTVKSAYTTPKGPVLRQRGKHDQDYGLSCCRSISSRYAELMPKSSAHNLCSDHYYKTDQAITFWSENCQKIQGVTPVGTRDTPFKKNASFSTPINETLDDTTHFTLENFPKIEDI
ncbi:sperm-associated antigen 8 [Brachyhypopomus gauderio]|uniref:sperm-associated antigen 8 n=1 Tax=Brachyhypopomus gauderio TaxID=698409 RepID=UPI004041ED9A